MRNTNTTKSWPAAVATAAAIVVTALGASATADQATRPGAAVNIVAPPGATAEPRVAAVGDTLGGELRVSGQRAMAGASSTVTIRGRVFFNDRRNHGPFSSRRELDGDVGTKCGTDGEFNDGTSCSLHW